MPPPAIARSVVQRHLALAAQQQELDRRGLRELRRARRSRRARGRSSRAASRTAVVERALGRSARRGGRQLRAAGELLAQALAAARGSRSRRSLQDSAIACSTCVQRASRAAARAGSRCRRRTGSCSGVRKTFSGQPPCPVIALHGLHAERVDVGALLAVDLDADEAARSSAPPCARPRRTRAPSRGTSDRPSSRSRPAAACPRLARALRAPRSPHGQPVDRVLGVLEQIGEVSCASALGTRSA